MLSVSAAEASTITVLIGDKDGFGGTQACAPCAPGDSFANLSSPSIVPGSYLGTAGMDATTLWPSSGLYAFTFTFAYDASALSSLTSAFVTIQTGSLAWRTDGSGFGPAAVTANGTGLGQFLTVPTGATASSLEESVKWHTFNVLPYLTTSGAATLTIVVDGLALPAPLDQFSIDWAELTIDGTSAAAVPEPATLTMLGAGLSGTIWRLRRRRHPRASGCRA